MKWPTLIKQQDSYKNKMKSNSLEKINSYVPNFIRRNFGRKVIAIFFAILVYVKVSNQLGEEQVFQRIPVHVVAQGNIEVMNFKPEFIDVTVKGTKRTVRLTTPTDINIEVSISKEVLKHNNFNINKSFIINLNENNALLPSGLTLIKLSPNNITVHCDKQITKTVPVYPVFKGSPPLDYARGDIKVIPQSVSLTGPQTILNDISSISTKPIFLDQTTVDDFQVERHMQLTDDKTLISPNTVQVKVEIYKTMGTRVFENIPVNILLGKNNTYFNSKLIANKVNITVRGTKSHLEILTRNDLIAFVDVANYNKPGIYQVKVDCWLNDSSIKVKFIEPAILNVELARSLPTSTKD